jgi:oligopeptidase B
MACILVGLHSTNTTEWLTIPSASPLNLPQVVMPRREGVEYALDHLTWGPKEAGWFVALTNDRAEDFRVVAAADDDIGGDLSGDIADTGTWRDVVPHRPGIRVEDLDAFAGALVLSERAEAQTQVRVLPLRQAGDDDPFGDRDVLLQDGWIVPSIDSPSTTWVGANPEPDALTLRIGRTSMVTPSSVLQIDLADDEHGAHGAHGAHGETLLKQEPVLGAFDPAAYTTYREWAAGADGVRVPISVVHRRDVTLPAPCVLYGYGAYEMSIDPSFSHHRVSLLDRGVVFAIAHVRGGGEMGRAWYEAGRMEHKANTFTDFLTVGRHLVARGIARADALAGRGASAGGLLIGAVANEAPELFRALVAQVPFVDCVTTMLDDELPLTVGEWEEWGNPLADETAYRRMLTYSPYDNVAAENADGTPRTYPDLFVTGGLNDPRVSFWEPAKWVAKIRALSPSTRVFLRTELGAGHGGPSGRYDAWKEEALVLAFLLDALGVVAPTTA